MFNINNVYKINSEVNKFIKLGKDYLGTLDEGNGVYKITCDCKKTDVLQSKRQLCIRIKEHKNNI